MHCRLTKLGLFRKNDISNHISTFASPGRPTGKGIVTLWRSILFDAHDGSLARDLRICPRVSEVDRHSDQEPADEPDPGVDIERYHHGETNQDACDGHERNERHAVAALQPGMRFAKHHD